MNNITYLLKEEKDMDRVLCKMDEKNSKFVKLVKNLTKQRKRLELYMEIG